MFILNWHRVPSECVRLQAVKLSQWTFECTWVMYSIILLTDINWLIFTTNISICESISRMSPDVRLIDFMFG